MASNNSEKGSENLYALLGLKKECTNLELRSAYKKLALVSFSSFFFLLNLFYSDLECLHVLVSHFFCKFNHIWDVDSTLADWFELRDFGNCDYMFLCEGSHFLRN